MLFAAPPNGKKHQYIFVQIHSIQTTCNAVEHHSERHILNARAYLLVNKIK
jgi:hypothetical protein